MGETRGMCWGCGGYVSNAPEYAYPCRCEAPARSYAMARRMFLMRRLLGIEERRRG